MFDLQVSELVIEGNGNITIFSPPLRQGGDFDGSDVLILVEADDSGEGLAVSPNGFDPSGANSTEKRHAFIARNLSDHARVGLSISSNVRRVVRVSFARLRKIAGWVWSDLSCPLCKRAVNMLVVTGLTLLGIPVPDDEVIQLLVEHIGGLLEYFAGTDYSEIIDVIDDILRRGGEIFGLWESFLSEVCRRIGACQ